MRGQALSHAPDRMTDNGFQPFRGAFARVAEINLMMVPLGRDIRQQSVGLREPVHPPDGLRLVVVRADVQALHAQPLLVGPEFHLGKIGLFFRAASAAAQSKSAFFTNSGSRMTEIQWKSSLWL